MNVDRHRVVLDRWGAVRSRRPRRVVAWLTCAWVAGTWLGQSLSGISWGWLCSLAALSAAWRRTSPRRTMLALLIISCGLAAWRVSLIAEPAERLWLSGTHRVVVVGLVERGTSAYGRPQQRCVVALTDATPVARVRLDVMGDAPRLMPGDQLDITGAAQRWSVPRTPGQRTAGGTWRVRAPGGRWRVNSSQVHVAASGVSGFRPWQQAHDGVRNVLRQRFTSHSASVLVAVLLGERLNVQHHLWSIFRRSGTAHLLAVSGLHVGLWLTLCVLCVRAMGRSRRVAAACGLLCALLWLGWAGASPSVVRSVIMACVGLSAWYRERRADVITAVAWAVWAVLLWQPAQLWQPGAWFSFAAVGGIIAWTPTLERVLQRRWGFQPLVAPPPSQGWLARGYRYVCRACATSLAVSTAATLAVAPLTGWLWGTVSPLAPLVNVLAVPWLAAVLCGGIVTVLGHAIGWTGAAWLAGLTDWWCLSGIALWEDWGQLPGAQVRVPVMGLAVVLWWWLGWSWSVSSHHMAQGIRRAVCVVLATTALVIGAAGRAYSRPRTPLEVTFLDVGHGDSAVIRSPQGGVIVVDAGGGGGWYASSTLVPYLRQLGVAGIDLVVATHADADHVGGVAALLEALPARLVVDSGITVEGDTTRQYHGALLTSGAQHQVVRRGHTIEGVPGLTVTVLHPPEHTPMSWGDNERSLVLLVQSAGAQLMLMADVENRGLFEFVMSGVADEVGLVKLPHHGGHVGPAAAWWADTTQADTVIISAPKQQRLSQTILTTQARWRERGARVFHTGHHGSLRCRWLDDAWVVEQWKGRWHVATHSD